MIRYSMTQGIGAKVGHGTIESFRLLRSGQRIECQRKYLSIVQVVQPIRKPRSLPAIIILTFY